MLNEANKNCVPLARIMSSGWDVRQHDPPFVLLCPNQLCEPQIAGYQRKMRCEVSSACAGLFVCLCCGKRRQQRSTAQAVRAAKQTHTPTGGLSSLSAPGSAGPANRRSLLTFWRKPQASMQDPELVYTRPPPPIPAYAAPTLAAGLDGSRARSGAAQSDAQPPSRQQARDQGRFRDRAPASSGRGLQPRPEPEGLVDVPLDDNSVTFSQRNALFQEDRPSRPSRLIVEAANPLAGQDFTGQSFCLI